jgi:hypothetical protein
MKYGFPKWFPYLLLGVMATAFGVCAKAALEWEPFSGMGAYVAFCPLGVVVFVFLTWSFLYAARYSVEVGSNGVSITGALRTRIIPLASIAQVITVSAPRSGTDSWLLDKNGACLAKFAGSLVGFEALLAELRLELRPYGVLFYRCGIWGAWEMQVAGDTKWVQSEAPPFVRKNDRRAAIALVAGLLLIILTIKFVSWR